MISISHWGMFEPAFAAPLMIRGFKPKDLEGLTKEWHKPDGYIEMVPLKIGDPQPLYHRLNFGKLD